MICCSKNSLMWVFVSEWTVLNTFLDFASEVLFLLSSYCHLCSFSHPFHQECSSTGKKGGTCDRSFLIERMMNFAGFDNKTIHDNIEKNNTFTMVPNFTTSHI